MFCLRNKKINFLIPTLTFEAFSTYHMDKVNHHLNMFTQLYSGS